MINSTEAEKLAFEFLTGEWNVPLEDQDWFTVISSRTLGEDGYDVAYIPQVEEESYGIFVA